VIVAVVKRPDSVSCACQHFATKDIEPETQNHIEVVRAYRGDRVVGKAMNKVFSCRSYLQPLYRAKNIFAIDAFTRLGFEVLATEVVFLKSCVERDAAAVRISQNPQTSSRFSRWGWSCG